MSKRPYKRLRGWDTYVEEADRPGLELPLPDGAAFFLKFPSKHTIDLLDKQREGDKLASDDDFAIALLGEAEGCRLLGLAAGAPVGTLQLMLGDAMVEWKLWKENPFRKTDDGDGSADATVEQGNSPSSPS